MMTLMTQTMPLPDPREQVVLVVDDFDDCRLLVAELLSDQGFVVHGAGDGMEGLARVQSDRPHVVIMDLSLPRMSGWDLVQRIKCNPETAGVRVIALTAHAMPEYAERARELGCDDFMTKPFQPDELIARVRALANQVEPEESGSARKVR
jgi:two-component system, cell cycle response regulator DivK